MVDMKMTDSRIKLARVGHFEFAYYFDSDAPFARW